MAHEKHEENKGDEKDLALSGSAAKKPSKLKRFWKRRKKLLIVLLVLIVILGVVVTKGLGGKEPAAPMVTTEEVQRQTVAELVSIKGTIEGSETAEVTSVLNNKIASINVKEGDRVEKGQTLAVLDGTDLQEAINKAQSEYEQTQYTIQDNLKTAQKEYDAAVRTMNESQRIYENNKELYEAGAISKEDFLKSETAYRNDLATVNTFDVSGGRVVASGSQSKNLEMQREEVANKSKNLQDIYIKSPISGTVTRVNAKLGRYAADTENKEAMFVIENLDQLQMKVMISENDISKIQLGQTVSISSDVLGDEKVEGVVSQIAPSGERKDQSSKEMVVPVKISVNSNGGKLMAGVTGNANILIHQSENAAAIPVDAILEDPETGDSIVFVVNKNNKLKKVVVKLGVESDFYAEETSGSIKEGDKVVMSPDFTMTDGMEVTLASQGGVQ